MWNETTFEKHLRERLDAELSADQATSVYGRYVATRDKVLNEITQIQGVEPSLSDHGPKHIRHVLNNALSLISAEAAVHGLTALDLYVLATCIVFHDVGNLFGRKDHHLHIGRVFDWARGTSADLRREKTLVIRAAQAHTGVSASGDKNTLVDVNASDHLDGEPIQLQSIASVLRLADELAEGPQRTTDFYRTQVGYALESQIFHQYAACTNVSADRGNERVRLTYEVQVDEFGGDAAERRAALAKFLSFLLQRVAKLDEERRYARFYCPVLAAFKQTDVAINFTNGPTLLAVAVRFALDDLVVPGQASSQFDARFPGKCRTPDEIAADVVTSSGNGGETQ